MAIAQSNSKRDPQRDQRGNPQGELDPIDPLDTRRYLIAIRRLADTLSHGTDHSCYLGSGVDFAQSRPYVPGDPVRAIDWRVTARTGEVYIKEYEAPKRMPVWLILDTSASMTFASTAVSKYAIATRIAGGLGLACLDRVSPVGLLGAGDRDLRVTPSLSKDQIMQWLVKLRRFRFGEGTSLGRRLAELNASLKHRALIIILSDMHDQAALPTLKLMGQVHDVVAIQLQDPAEKQLRGAGLMRAEEAESGASFVTHGRRDWIDAQQVRDELRRAGLITC